MRSLMSRERRLSAIALLIGILVVTWAFMISPLIDGVITRGQARDALTAEYVRNDRILAGLPGWRMQAEEQANTAASYALAAPNSQIAAELVLQRIARDAKAASAPAPVTQVITENVSPGWVHVRSNLQLTIGQLYAVLTRIQSEEPYVVVGYFSVETRPNPNPNEPQSMDVRLDIFAPVRASGSSPQARVVARRS